jgi:steroid 5-alpha reductase family enzyme
MRFVDIAWPFGLVFLSVFAFIFGTAPLLRKSLICSCYLFQGLRMGMGSLKTIPYMKSDFPRYEYAKMKILRKGKNLKLSIVVDIMLQSMANCGLLALPLLIIAFDKT